MLDDYWSVRRFYATPCLLCTCCSPYWLNKYVSQYIGRVKLSSPVILTPLRAEWSIYIGKERNALRDIKFMLRRVNGDRRNNLRRPTLNYSPRILIETLLFSPAWKCPPPLLRDFETNGVYQNFDFSSPVDTRETIEETTHSKRKETRGVSNISAQLVTALPTRESDVN